MASSLESLHAALSMQLADLGINKCQQSTIKMINKCWKSWSAARPGFLVPKIACLLDSTTLALLQGICHNLTVVYVCTPALVV